MKIFVTGATGFVGSHLVSALFNLEHDVVCLARDATKVRRVFPDRAPEVVIGSLEHEEALRRGAAGADVVFHVAGVIAAPDRAGFFRVNATATERLANIVAEVAPNLQRFVYVSSLSAVGPTTVDHPLTESTAPQPVSDYGRSKLAAEEAVRSSGLPFTIVRPPAVYGPRDVEMFKVFQLARIRVTPIFGDGSQQLSLLYAPDLAQALVATLTSTTVGQTYFACHRELHTSRTFATEVYRSVTGKSSEPLFIRIPGPVARGLLWVTGNAARLAHRATVLSQDKAQEFLAEAWTCTPDALERDTGWKAATNLTTGVSETTTWYRSAGWL